MTGPAGVKPGAWRADWGSLRNKAISKDVAASIEQSLVATMVSTLIPPKVHCLALGTLSSALRKIYTTPYLQSGPDRPRNPHYRPMMKKELREPD
ncbi:hypothetical protein E4T45_10236 [Aureobasidium sp. EXF-8846]|nr:hypothetical protein E4T45_10236 [Aureobasidium sp. EXF-8846]